MAREERTGCWVCEDVGGGLVGWSVGRSRDVVMGGGIRILGLDWKLVMMMMGLREVGFGIGIGIWGWDLGMGCTVSILGVVLYCTVLCVQH